MRIGLFGGTFNPIHHCHLTVAAQTRDRLGLDRILFIPTGTPPHKPSTSLAPAQHRLEMVRRAVACEPTFAVTDVEVRRKTKSYSIETVHALQAELGPAAKLFFIIGLDAFLDFPTWRQATDLLQACHFTVIARPGTTFRSLHGMPLIPEIEPAILDALDRGQQTQARIPLPGGSSLILLSLPPCRISASDIRSRIRRGLSISSLLPASVESYIIAHQLYREGTDQT